MDFTAQEVIDHLDLKPLSFEGGYYKETYLSKDRVKLEEFADRYDAHEFRSMLSAIYYLLTPETYSRLHRLPTDEIFHFYMGDPVEMVTINSISKVEIIKIGNQLEQGCQPQVVIPQHTWQGSRLVSGGKFALMGTTMSPAFAEKDFESAALNPEFLNGISPKYKDLIQSLL